MTDATAGAAPAAADEKTFLGHPRGLVTLFFTEMWERFSFYGMRALLVIYLTQHFLFSDQKAQGLYGAYAALVYLIPVVGGVIADRFLGSRKAVTIGAALLVLGHFGMAFEGRGSVQELTFQGQTYDIVADGRGDNRELFLISEGERYPVNFTPDGMNVERAANGVPPFVATDDFTLSTRPDVLSLGGLSIPYEQILYLSLALIICGVGFLKANISTTVGALYETNDPRRDGGFTIFYMGINLGAVLATALCGWLGQTYGWKYGFGLAGFGMLLGLLQYLFGQHHLKGKAEPPRPLSSTVEGMFWVLGLIAVIPAWFLVQQIELMETALPLLVPGLFVLVLVLALVGFKGAERSKMVAALVLIVFSVVFWMLFEQAGSSLSLFAERSTDLTIAAAGTPGHTIVTGALFGVAAIAALTALACFWWLFRKAIDLVIFGYGIVFLGGLAALAAYIGYTTGLGGGDYEMTAAQTQTFNPGLIVLLGLPFAAMWVALNKMKFEPSTPMKFALGLIQVGLGFFVLVFGVQFAGEDFRVPLTWLFMLYVLHTTGELFLSPVGLSMITKLSAARVVGLMMGVWFLSSSLAHILAAQIAKLTASDTVAGQVVNPEAQLQSYQTVFSQVGIAGLVAGGALLLLTPMLKKWMGEVR